MNLRREYLTQFLETCQLTSGPLSGGLRDGFDLHTKNFKHIYSETTGYLVSYFVHLYNETKNESYLSRAKLAGDFLVSQNQQGRLPYDFNVETLAPSSRFYVFDNAICIGGLCDIYTATRDQKYLSAAEEIGNWICGEMLAANGSWLAYYDATNQTKEHPGTDFASDHGSIQLKNVIALLKLGEATENPRWKLISTTALNLFANERQRDDGGFVIQAQNHDVFSHGHSYVTEGYLYAYSVTQDERYKAIALRAARYLQTAQSSSGGIYQFNQSGVTAADATAQAIRIWRLSNLMSPSPDLEKSIRKSLRYLESMTDRESGAIRYTRDWLGRKSSFCFTWVAMFASSALCVLEESQPLYAEIY